MRNKFIKKITALLLCTAVILSFCGCSKVTALYTQIAESFSDDVYFERIHEEFQKVCDNHLLNSTFHYNKLDETGKRTYEALIVDIFNFPEELRIPRDTNKTQLFDAVNSTELDCPELFFINANVTLHEREHGNIYLEPTYEFSKEKYESIISKANNNIKNIVKKAKGEKSIYNKALAVHDYIVKFIKYDMIYDTEARSIYGGLVTGNASCQGYSQAFQYIMNKAGCYTVNTIEGNATDSDGKTQGHAWNSITLDDGKNYYLDTTWDDSNEEVLSHAYFLIGEKELSLNHSDFKTVGHLGTEHLYFNKNGLLLSGSMSDIEKDLTSLLADCAKKGKKSLEIKLKNPDKTDEFINEFFKDKKFFRCVDSVKNKTGIYITDRVTYYYEEEIGSINIVF